MPQNKALGIKQKINMAATLLIISPYFIRKLTAFAKNRAI